MSGPYSVNTNTNSDSGSLPADCLDTLGGGTLSLSTYSPVPLRSTLRPSWQQRTQPLRRDNPTQRLRGVFPASFEGPRGICNFGDMRCRWRSFPPLHDPQKSGGSFSKSFQVVLLLLVHMASDNGRNVKSVVKR
jgi:hypothetical protein